MLIFPSEIKIYLSALPTDMRKSFQTLSAVVLDKMDLEPTDGSMYVFWNKGKDKLKILQWGNKGVWLHYNRLSEGKFFIPKTENKSSVLICQTEITRLLSGIDLSNITALNSNKGKYLF